MRNGCIFGIIELMRGINGNTEHLNRSSGMIMDIKAGKKKQNLKFAFITLAAMIALTVILLLIFVGAGSGTVRLSDYVTFTYTGVNGGGTLSCVLDNDGLYKRIAGDEKNAVLLRSIDTLVDGIKVTPDKTSKLNNGEEVHVRIEYDETLAKKAGCRFSGTEYSVTVSGLGKGEVIDIFSNVDVIVAGISPVAYANVVNRWQEDYLKNISFSLDKSADIELGDIITVTCEADDNELAGVGISIYEKTKQFKVDKVSSYVKSTDEIDKEILQDIVNDCKDTIKTETEDLTFRMLYKASRDSAYLFQYNNESAQDIVLQDAKFLYRRDGHDVKHINYIELIFKSNISNGVSQLEVYFIFEFPDMVLSTDKTFQITRNDLKNKYICDIDYNSIYSSMILGRENVYTISQIDGLN